MKPVIEVKSLSKNFGNIQAVKDLSFTVYEGDVYGFLGQNGAGKSTTLRMLLTLIQPTEGSIEIFGKALPKNRIEVLRTTGAMIERPDLYSYLSGLENLKLFAKMSGCSYHHKDLMEHLDRVGLSGRAISLVKTYSLGMKQRLGIAVALVHDPTLIILDEPTNGLDPQGIAEMRNLISRLSRDFHKTVVVSSHLLSELEQVANRVLIMDRGKKVVEGELNSLANPKEIILEITTRNRQQCLVLLRNSKWSDLLLDEAGNGIRLKLAADQIPDLSRQLVEWNQDILSLQRQNLLEAYFLSLISKR